jgi:hypothetical protein
MIPKKELRVKVWEKDATFNTNNYIEPYHNQLKLFYFCQSRNTHVDRIVNILSQLVVAEYCQEAVQVQYGYKKMFLSSK